MNKYFEEFINDLNNFELPENVEFCDKVKCALKTGKRVYWYYKEDLEYFKDCEEDIHECKSDIFSGICIPRPGIDSPYEMDITECVIISDNCPTEKEYPEVEWITLGRLLNNPDLIEVFASAKDEKN